MTTPRPGPPPPLWPPPGLRQPPCAPPQITKVMLLKGWRCVECIVCEVCGKASDPSRLLLCDDCDISYHTYCLDPPLQTVPKGGWKCKWYVAGGGKRGAPRGGGVCPGCC